MTVQEAMKTLKDRGAVEDVGRGVMKEAIKRAMMDQAGVFIPDFVININKGELVPEALRNDPNIKFDSQFSAMESHCKAWCKVEDYCKCWGKCTDSAIKPALFERTSPADMAITNFEALAKSILTDSEIAELKRLKIL